MGSVNQYVAVMAQRCFEYPVLIGGKWDSFEYFEAIGTWEWDRIDHNETNHTYGNAFQWSQFGDRDERTALIYTIKVNVSGGGEQTNRLETRVRDVDNNLVLMELSFNAPSIGTFRVESTPPDGWPGAVDGRLVFEAKHNSTFAASAIYFAALHLKRT